MIRDGLHVSTSSISAARMVGVLGGQRSKRLDKNPVELFRFVVNVARQPVTELDARRVDVRIHQDI